MLSGLNCATFLATRHITELCFEMTETILLIIFLFICQGLVTIFRCPNCKTIKSTAKFANTPGFEELSGYEILRMIGAEEKT